MKSQVKISLITVCHNSKEDMGDYVSSFLQFHSPETDKPRYEFVFVENSGQPELREVVRPLIDSGYEVLVIDAKNDGFGAACNLGATKSTGTLLAFVNPDVRFSTCLDPLAEFTEHACWGTVRQLMPSGQMHSVDLFPEHKNIFFEFIKGHRLLNKFNLFSKHCYVVGSFLVSERRTFEWSGGFNEAFFLYYEEAELCRRLQLTSGRPYIENNVVVVHQCFGSHETPAHALKYAAEGFITYCQVTSQQHLIRSHVRQLRVLGLFSKTAKTRSLLLREIVRNRNLK